MLVERFRCAHANRTCYHVLAAWSNYEAFKQRAIRIILRFAARRDERASEVCRGVLEAWTGAAAEQRRAERALQRLMDRKQVRK
jgi:hypothetical protein